MASCDWKKIKTSVEAKAMFRHSCLDSRLENEHSNKQIDKYRTKYNLEFGHMRKYEDACKRYDEIIQNLDSKEGANKRKDRVTLVGLSIPCPDGMMNERMLYEGTPYEESKRWFQGVYEQIQNKYGDNVIGGSVHYDEVHEYRDSHNNVVMSRPHLHVYVVPEVNEKLNAKQFTSKTNMIVMNNDIEDFTKQYFPGYKFMDGSKRKSKQTVEELKNESVMKEADARADEILYEAQKRANDIIRRADEEVMLKHQEMKKIEQRASTLLREAQKYNDASKDLYETLKQTNDMKRQTEDMNLLEYTKSIHFNMPDGSKQSAYERFCNMKNEREEKLKEQQREAERKMKEQQERNFYRRLPKGVEDLKKQSSQGYDLQR